MNTLVTWENLQAKLFHLGWLGEELPAFVGHDPDRDGVPTGAWLFRQIVTEATTVAAIAAAYVAECERAGITGPNGTTPAPPSWRCADETRPDTARAEDAGPAGPVVPSPGDRYGDNTPDAADLRREPEGGDAL